MKRFIPWLIPIVVLLASIPVLIHFNQVLAAKLIGFVVIIVTSVALRVWLRNANRIKSLNPSVKFNVNDRFYLKEHILDYRNASPRVRKEMERKMGVFLANTKFDSSLSDELSKEDCLVAAYYCVTQLGESSPMILEKGMIVFSPNELGRIENRGDQSLLFVDPTFILTSMKSNDADASSLNHDEIKRYLLGKA